MNISFPTLRQFRKNRAEKKLGKAIAEHDTAAIAKCLEDGARQIDFLLWRDGDRPGERVPVAKFTDPRRLAEYVGMKGEGLRLLAAHGLGPTVPEPVAPPRA